MAIGAVVVEVQTEEELAVQAAFAVMSTDLRGDEQKSLTPCVLSDSQDRSIIDLRIAICHTCSDRSILDLRMACGTQRVLVDLLNAALCPERV